MFFIFFPENTLNLVEFRRGLFPLTFSFRVEFKTFLSLDFRKWNEIFNSQNNPNLSLFKNSDTKVVWRLKYQRVDLLLYSLIIRRVSELFATGRRLEFMD
jgi:hypothetical protein